MTNQWGRRLLIASIIAILSTAFFMRLRLAQMAQFPGHGDYAYYFTVARNIADGRWLQIDYIWHYLNGLPPITHYSTDFWMPLTSILAGLAMLALGKSLFAAILPSIVTGVAICIPTYLIGNAYSGSRRVALAAAGLILFLPVLFKYSLLTDSSVYYTLLVSFSLFFMVKGYGNPKFILLAAGLTGLAHLTRQDGILVLCTLLVTIGIAPLPVKTKLSWLLFSVGIYSVVLSPLMIKNYQELGVFFPSGSSKTMFLTTYEDFYVYGKELNLKQYLAQGIAPILKFKLETAIYNLGVIYKSLGIVLTVLVIAGAVDHAASASLRKKWRAFLPPVLLFVFIYAFYTIIASYSSYGTGFRRSLMGVTPFLVILAVDFVFRRVCWRPLILACWACLMVFFGVEAYQSTQALLVEHNRLGEELAPLREMVLEDAAQQGLPQQEIVLMARDVWEVYEVIQLDTIQIPNNDVETIYQIARHYQASYLLLPARREALEPLYENEASDPRFSLVGQLLDSGLKLFRIDKEIER